MERYKTVLNGRDPEAIDILIKVHCSAPDPKILDVTHNTGKMWKDSTYKPVKMDINPELDFAADWKQKQLNKLTVSEGRKLIELIDNERKLIGPNGPPTSLMTNALLGLMDIFNHIEKQNETLS